MSSDKNNRQSVAAYTDEVLSANWHPLVLKLAEPLARLPKAALEPAEAEDFLARLYVGQRA
jgi:hypothetical protein